MSTDGHHLDRYQEFETVSERSDSPGNAAEFIFKENVYHVTAAALDIATTRSPDLSDTNGNRLIRFTHCLQEGRLKLVAIKSKIMRL